MSLLWLSSEEAPNSTLVSETPTYRQVAPPIFLPLPGKHGHYRVGVGQKGGHAACAPAATRDTHCCMAFHTNVEHEQRSRVLCLEPASLTHAWAGPVDSSLHSTICPLCAGLAVFMNSLGELTAYDSEGDLEWQVGAHRGTAGPS